VLEVNEEGSEAAAATFGVTLVEVSASLTEPPQFIADHPFMVFIVDNRAVQAVLFTGRLTKPPAAGAGA
jgi:serpin B